MLLQADVITQNSSSKTWKFHHYLITLMSILNNVLDLFSMQLQHMGTGAFKCQKGCKITVKVAHTTSLDSLDSKSNEDIHTNL